MARGQGAYSPNLTTCQEMTNYQDMHFIFSRHPNLELVKGDACDVESFVSALQGKDAVVSGLGVVASIFNPTTFYSESMHAIMEGMKRYVKVININQSATIYKVVVIGQFFYSSKFLS